MPCFPSVEALPELPEAAMLLVNHERVEAALERVPRRRHPRVRRSRHRSRGGSGRQGGDRAGRTARPRGRRDDGRARTAWARSSPARPRCGSGARLQRPQPGTSPSSRSRARSPTRSSRSAGRIGLRYVISAGAEAATGAADYLHHFAQDEGTRAVGLFLETVREPARFVEGLAACAAAGKPVVCLKVGRSEAAARAALSHTGALVGSGHAFSAVLRRHGAIEVDDFHELRRDARDPRQEALARRDADRRCVRVRWRVRPARRSGRGGGDPVRASLPRARRPTPGALPQLPRSRQSARFLGGRRGRGDLPRLARAAGRLGRLRHPRRPRRPLAVPRRRQRGVVRDHAPGARKARGRARALRRLHHGAQRRSATSVPGARARARPGAPPRAARRDARPRARRRLAGAGAARDAATPRPSGSPASPVPSPSTSRRRSSSRYGIRFAPFRRATTPERGGGGVHRPAAARSSSRWTGSRTRRARAASSSTSPRPRRRRPSRSVSAGACSSRSSSSPVPRRSSA